MSVMLQECIDALRAMYAAAGNKLRTYLDSAACTRIHRCPMVDVVEGILLTFRQLHAVTLAESVGYTCI